MARIGTRARRLASRSASILPRAFRWTSGERPANVFPSRSCAAWRMSRNVVMEGRGFLLRARGVAAHHPRAKVSVLGDLQRRTRVMRRDAAVFRGETKSKSDIEL